MLYSTATSDRSIVDGFSVRCLESTLNEEIRSLDGRSDEGFRRLIRTACPYHRRMRIRPLRRFRCGRGHGARILLPRGCGRLFYRSTMGRKLISG